MLSFYHLVQPDHLFHLLTFFCGYFAEGEIFFTGGLALFRGKFAPCLQTVIETLFLLEGKIRVVLSRFEQAVLLYFRQVIPLLRHRGKSFLLHGVE